MVRPRPDITPVVKVWSSAKGLPMARANCPTCSLLLSPCTRGTSTLVGLEEEPSTTTAPDVDVDIDVDVAFFVDVRSLRTAISLLLATPVTAARNDSRVPFACRNVTTSLSSSEEATDEDDDEGGAGAFVDDRPAMTW